MEQNRSSATSLGVASLRAAHQIIDGEPRLLNDPVIVRLFGQDFVDHIKDHPDAYRGIGSIRLRSHVLLRSRYAEDCLAHSYAQGIRQYLLLGAGLDTYAWRQAPGLEELQIFEADHPATQKGKKEKLAQAGLAIPENCRFIPLDFERTTLAEALDIHGFDADRPVFVSWLGVMVYLTMEAIDAVFDWLLARPAGSEMVLTFTQKRPFNPLAARAAELGEPWRTFFTPAALVEKLLKRGFSAVHILEPREAERLYFSGRKDGLPPPAHASIARIIV